MTTFVFDCSPVMTRPLLARLSIAAMPLSSRNNPCVWASLAHARQKSGWCGPSMNATSGVLSMTKPCDPGISPATAKESRSEAGARAKGTWIRTGASSRASGRFTLINRSRIVSPNATSARMLSSSSVGAASPFSGNQRRSCIHAWSPARRSSSAGHDRCEVEVFTV